jgi:hypothetical protein
MSRTVLGILVVVVLIVIVLFATGFWKANVKEGQMPKVVAEGGKMPSVDVDSKKLVVGTTQANVEVPTVDTETKKIDVPVVGVTDGKKD